MAILKYDGTLAAVTASASASQYSTDATETLSGTAAPDSLWGGAGDLLQGGAGDDTYTLGSLTTRINELAGQGTDKLAAWASLDLVNYANVENLQVNGDGLYAAGSAADNIIEGDAASQQIYGDRGQDVLIGGGGADTFLVIKGQGNDVIQDFSSDDVVRLSAGFTSFADVQAHLSQSGADVKLDMAGGDGLLFRNATVSQFNAANFQLQLDTHKLGAMTFHDEFSASLSLWDAQSNPGGAWRPDYGFSGSQGVGSYTLASNGELQIYTSPYFRDHPGDFSESPFVSNSDGTLSIIARPSSNPEIFGYHYTSGEISTAPSFAQTYGYFEMRAELPSTAGAWPAFWLVPADGSWPPELDVMETLTTDPRGAHTTEHSGATGTHTQLGYTAFVPDTADGFHTYGVLWTSTDLNWFIDGVEVFHTATPADMNKPMYMIANLALGGWGGAIDNANMPAEMKIDYVRAYALADSSNAVTRPADAPATGSTGITASAGTTGAISGTADGGVVLTAPNDSGSLITGGAGADTLVASRGADTLTGGGGADVFKFTLLPWSTAHITDFQVGTDVLDLRPLFTAAGYHGVNPVSEGYLSLVSDGAGGTKVYFDLDGSAPDNPWPFLITVLDHVQPAGLQAGRDWLFSTVTTSTTSTAATSTAPSTLIGHDGGESLAGAAGPDTITAGVGVNYLRGNDGDDVITGGPMFDDINGNKGEDTLHGGGGGDWVVGGQGGDLLYGDAGDDVVLGNLGADTLDGGAGADIMRGGQSDDVLTGGDGDDWLSGDRGNDTVAGGAGADIFHGFSDAGLDVVTDFNRAQGDRVLLDPGTAYTLSQQGADTVIDMGGGNEMILKGVQLASLSSGWIFGM
jgi:beta-glucanase (GH16 family)